MLSSEPPDEGCGRVADCCCGAVTTGVTGAAGVLWTLKSDREAISLSSSSVADVAEGFAKLEEEVVALSLILSLSSFLEEGNWAKISSVILNWVALSSCNRWSNSLRPPPNSEEEEKAGGGSTVRGERGLHTVLYNLSGLEFCEDFIAAETVCCGV